MARRVETEKLFTAILEHVPAGPAERAEIRVDAFQTLIGALVRNGIHLVTDPSATGHSFAGIPVIADPKMPAGFAAIVVNKDVVQIVDLRPVSAQKEKAE